MRAYPFQRLVNDIRMLKMVIREEVELVEEVANIDAAERIHLREWQYARKSSQSLGQRIHDASKWAHSRQLLRALLLREPAHVDNLLIFLKGIDSHRHVVIS